MDLKAKTKHITQKGLLHKLSSTLIVKPLSGTLSVSSSTGHNDAAEGTTDLKKELIEIRNALDHFLNSDIREATGILKPRYKESMYHALGYSFILYLKCLMTFENEDIEYTLEVINHTIQLADSLRKKENGWLHSVTSWVKGTTLEDVKSMNAIERHAELVYAEAYLLKALLSIVHDESVMSFLRESIHIRSSYNTYTVLEKYIDYVEETKSSKTGEDVDFISGVYLGVGCFNLILSMLPTSVVKVAEFIGFSSDRTHGLRVLEYVGGWKTPKEDNSQHNGLRRPLCDMVLIMYHIILSKFIPLSDIDIEFAETILNEGLKKYPHGVFFLYFNGRSMVSKKMIEEGMNQYQLAIDTQKDWKQLQHMCYWEMGIIYIMQQQWLKAYGVYSILQKESNWSKAVYTYLKAVSLYMVASELNDNAEKVKALEKVSNLMVQVSGEKQKIAGKSIPMEKFLSRKSRKFKIQKEYLLLPDLEVLSAMSAFDSMPKSLLETNLKRISSELDRLERLDVKNETYYDDYCLAQYLRSITTRKLYETSPVEQIKKINENSLKELFQNAERIEYDHYIYYFGRYENALMLLLEKDYLKAEAELQIILKANDKGQFVIGSSIRAKNKYSLASSLAFKCHNCLSKIKKESNK